MASPNLAIGDPIDAKRSLNAVKKTLLLNSLRSKARGSVLTVAFAAHKSGAKIPKFVKEELKMKRLVFLALLSAFAACQTVPITGRSQLLLVSTSQVAQLSDESYRQVLLQSQVIKTGAQAETVKTVGQKIAKAAQDFLAQNGLESSIAGYCWEFNLIKDDKTANAFCMPGGKIVVYTGILPYTKNEQGLAVVLGHEVAHAIANHGAERMSQSLLVEYGGTALSMMIANKPAETQQLFMTAYGAGTQLGVVLPYSRKHELEADRIGLILMAKAGYDPNGAITFWQSMSAGNASSASGLFSTHPSDGKRIEELKKLIAEAMPYYKKL
jgi:predicted Zn-dependent protease